MIDILKYICIIDKNAKIKPIKQFYQRNFEIACKNPKT